MLRRYSAPLLLLLLSVAATACTQVDSTRLRTTGQSCARTDDCQPGLACVAQVCVAADGDALGDDGEGTDVDTTPGPPVGAWTDPLSGLTWQVEPSEQTLSWAEAVEYCRNLEPEGTTQWRLPNISELRTLVRGCPATEIAGSCKVLEDGCLAHECRDSTCTGCLAGLGPGVEGAYWPDELRGDTWSYWSSSPVQDIKSHAWRVAFARATVYFEPLDYHKYVRCVR